MTTDSQTASSRLRSHVECLKTHTRDAHDALTECAIELAALAESGRIQLHVNRDGVRALLFQVAESNPQELALAALKLHAVVHAVIQHAEIDDEVLSTVIQLHTGLAALKGERAS